MRKNELIKILELNPAIQEILNLAPFLGMPNWYLGAGMIAQTVWNHKHGFELNSNIKDCDLIYFDIDTSFEKEDAFIKKGLELFKNVSMPVDIKNEARVHLWYKKHFGYDIPSYTSSEHAIDTWPTTATSVAIRKTSDGDLDIYAPFGLDDLLNMVVRPNKKQITEEIYLKKVDRWKKHWPNLKIVPW